MVQQILQLKKYKISLLTDFQVINIEVTANDREQAEKKAKSEAELMGWRDTEVI